MMSLYSYSSRIFIFGKTTNRTKPSKVSNPGANFSFKGFPGGAVDKNLPAKAGDTGSIPGLGRSHMLQSNKARVPQLLSLSSRACEPQLLSPRATTTEPMRLEPMLLNKRSHRNEKPAHRNEG